jgi:polyhydroxybutyrate depolymerase
MGLVRLAVALAVAAASAAVMIAAASGGDGVPRAAAHTAAQTADHTCAAGDHTLHFTIDGQAHQALLHVPPSRAGRLPLVVAFHGAQYGARFVSVYYGLSPVADAQGFAVLYPQASHDVFWQLPANQTEDVEAVRVLLDRAVALSCVDATRVYATGASNGGGFAARLGCEMADRLAAIAPVAGGYAPLGPCHPARPLPVLEIHGTRDQVVPYGGKGDAGDGSVAHFLGEWKELDGCTGPADRTVVARGVTRLVWDRCQGDSVVEHLRLAGTNHGWPGGDTDAAGLKNHPIPSQDPTGVNAAEAVWDFLSKFRLPAPAAGS